MSGVTVSEPAKVEVAQPLAKEDMVIETPVEEEKPAEKTAQ